MEDVLLQTYCYCVLLLLLLLLQTLKTISEHALGLTTSWVQLNVSAGAVIEELFASHEVKWRNEAQHGDRTQTLSSY